MRDKAEGSVAALVLVYPDAIALVSPVAAPVAAHLMRAPAGHSDNRARYLLRVAPFGQHERNHAVRKELAVTALGHEAMRLGDVFDPDRNVVNGQGA